MPELPTISCLQAFESVARHGSITRASVELSLTQSAVSRQIHQLESLLDVSLFERVRQRVVITDAGKLYLNDVSRVMSGLKDATSRIMACGGKTNLLNLAVLPTFATRWLMPRLNDFLEKHPGVTINLATRLVPFDFGMEPFDAGIHYGSPDWPGAVAHHLVDEVTVPVCSPKLKEAQRIRRPADLARAVLLHQTTRTEAWTEWFQMTGVDSPQALRGPRFEQFAMITQAAICDLGVALLPKLLIEEELTSGKLVLLFDRPLRSANAYYLVVPESKTSAILPAAFAQWIIGQAKSGSKES
ncbi:LysR family transcriptional regulator [Edaphobacter dinghuensis]|uniref:Transcriptional regulator n=1 Tax=Edaphobacter dinghuensis TaxID=1560005 RepID=A0A917HKH2_9BACT|nr:LysR family transcriptional regulator [Edaphobacter dinghuensis]GGG82331.1 transcriptional regulator [Edaphobacter dinghuensis]